jgi:hypothetical protein
MKLTQKDFALSFGVSESEIPEKTAILISELDFEIEAIVGKERDNLIIQIIDKIRSDEQEIASPVRKIAWEEGWAENLKLYTESGGLLSTLVPKFIRSGNPIRWFGKYFRSNDINFELNYTRVLREFIFETYFADLNCLYEFGAGTGFNLIHASNSLPGVKLVGTDFVTPAVELIARIGEDLSIPLTSSLFDMTNPSGFNLSLDSESGVVTFGSLEQLGGNLKPMIDYLCQQKPTICVHVEPAIELYDPTSLEDYFAIWFQGKRGYSAGLISLLEEYQANGLLRIRKIQRLNFGSLMMEGFNLIVWEPI